MMFTHEPSAARRHGPGPAATADVRRSGFVDRRTLLALGSAFAGTVIVGRAFPATAEGVAVGQDGALGRGQLPGSLPQLVSAFLSVLPDGRLGFTCPAAEIGQGVTTALAQIVADEFGVSLDRVAVSIAGAGEIFVNPGKGTQSVGQSYSVRGYLAELRLVAAAARGQFEAAAAHRWGVAPASCRLADGHVEGPGGRIPFHLLSEDAQRIPPSETPRLRSTAERRVVGRRVPQRDSADLVLGRTVYAIDAELPGMLVAAVAFPPAAGGRLERFDHTAARARPGVVAVLAPESPGDPLAVLAEDWWTAREGLEAAAPRFTGDPVDAAILTARIRAGLAAAPIPVAERGNPDALFAAAADRVELTLEVPFLAHAPMEPMSVVADARADGCLLMGCFQSQTRARDAVARQLGLAPARVEVRSLRGGGGFGRRWYTDHAVIAARLSQRAGRPVKLVYSREADLAHDWYRPAFACKARAALAGGSIAALDFHLAGPSISEFGRPGRLGGRHDPVAVSGLPDLPYDVPGLRVGWSSTPTPVPVGVWRSVGHSHNGFFLETLINESAARLGADPLALRRRLLAPHPEALAVLDAVARAARWGRRRPAGTGLGLAVAESYGSWVAQVVEVRREGGRIAVPKVWAAIACGETINPAMVEAQLAGASLFGLEAALWGEVLFEGGAAACSNFHDYRVLTVREAPRVEAQIVRWPRAPGALPGGAGEPGVVPIAAALVAAIAAAGGPWIRRLPVAAMEGLEA